MRREVEFQWAFQHFSEIGPHVTKPHETDYFSMDLSKLLINEETKGAFEVVELLIANGADVNAKGKLTNKTPLDLAIFWKQTETADLIRKHAGKMGEELKAEGK
jgi:ankyrin repeat protein